MTEAEHKDALIRGTEAAEAALDKLREKMPPLPRREAEWIAMGSACSALLVSCYGAIRTQHGVAVADAWLDGLLLQVSGTLRDVLHIHLDFTARRGFGQ